MKVLINNSEIVGMCKDIGYKLTQKLRDKNPIIVGVLKGACPFHNELIKYIDLPLEIDYIQVSSYVGVSSSGTLTLKKDIDYNIEGRDIVIVEDIVDTGLTLSKLKKMLEARNPNSLTFVSMLDKPCRRKVDFKPDYVGKTIDDLFVVGFGLDLNERYRELKDICICD